MQNPFRGCRKSDPSARLPARFLSLAALTAALSVQPLPAADAPKLEGPPHGQPAAALSQDFDERLWTLAFGAYAQAYSKQAGARKAMEDAISEALSPQVAQYFGHGKAADGARESVRYLGEVNLMLGLYRQATGSDTYDSLSTAISEELADRYRRAPSRNLETFPDDSAPTAHPADNALALASLKVHDANYGTKFSLVAPDWSRLALKSSLDERGLVAMTVLAKTGAPLQPATGTSTAALIIFTAYFDPALSRAQYAVFRQNFLGSFAGGLAFNENADGSTKPNAYAGTVYSGGAGRVATIMGLGAAKCAGDTATANGIARLLASEDRLASPAAHAAVPPLWRALRSFNEALPQGR